MIVDLKTYKRRKSIAKSIEQAETLMKDLDASIKILAKYQDYGMIRPVLNELKEKHDNIFKFIVKKNQELGKLINATEGSVYED